MGVTGTPSKPLETGPVACMFEDYPITHSFLVIPSCPIPLLGRDLLSKLGASISLPLSHPQPNSLIALASKSCGPEASTDPTVLPTDVNPIVWDNSTPAVVSHHAPVLIRLKDPSSFPSMPQFPISQAHRKGIQLIINRLLSQGLLVPTNSPCNTPILPAKKPSGAYQLVQDLRITNEAVVPLHPVAPSPHTLLFQVPPDTSHLKDAFLTIPLHPKSQLLFAFTWEDPDTCRTRQLTWTVLPQGFQDSPHLFGQALAEDLSHHDTGVSTLLQYVDDNLLCSPTEEASAQDTASLLNFLAQRGYRGSASKAQLSTPQVTYLQWP